MRRVKLNDGKRTLGVINNVTASYREKETLLFERNFDALCGIYNRRAFSEKLSKLFENGGLGIGAFMMFDIDNLKYINDNYGHDFGDRYIQSAANSLVEKFKTVPKKIYGRRSGDEFYAFIYGYESLDEVKKEVKEIHDSFRTVSLAVTGGETIRVRVSGGVSLYPQDSADCESLMRFADFAMYEIKTTAKGEPAYYDSREKPLPDEERGPFQSPRKRAGRIPLSADRQPADGRNLRLRSADARSLAPAFKSPQDIFNVARYHYRLGQMENLTFFKSIKDFTALGISDRRLFINSVPSQNLKDEEWEELTALYGKKLENIVVEFTEYERASYNAMQYKLKRIRDCGAYVALDDYGTGYNGEAILLECFPDFVKIDILLVRNVDKDAERQKMISNLVEFAKARKMRCIAEGVETKEELETVILSAATSSKAIMWPVQTPPVIPEKQQADRNFIENIIRKNKRPRRNTPSRLLSKAEIVCDSSPSIGFRPSEVYSSSTARILASIPQIPYP
ncbi:MAG: diguanylate cyclase [Christensenellaceae bacterium]